MAYNNNPFGAARAPHEVQPQGIMQVATPDAPMVQDPPGIKDMAMGKAQEMAMAKGEEYLMGALNPAASAAAPAATGLATSAASAAAPAAAAGKGAGGMMAAAAPMVAPALLGGLVLSKLFK